MKKILLIIVTILFANNIFAINSPSNYSPSNDATLIHTSKSIICRYVDGITNKDYYTFEMDTTPNFNSPLLETSTATYYSSGYLYKSNSNLLYGTKYYWHVKVTNGTETSDWSVTWNFTTLFRITPDTPSNNSTGNYTDRSIICDREYNNNDFENYDFEMDTTPNFNSALHTISHGTYYNSSWIYKSNTDLLYGTKYYWRARVRNANDTSEWSVTWNFTTLSRITPDTPSNNSTVFYTDRSIICDREYNNNDFDNYEFEMDTTPNFNSALHTISHGTYYNSSWIYKSNTDLLYGTKYYWRARVRNANDTSEWSVTWNFTTLNNITLDTPANNSTGNYTDRSIIVDREYNNNNFDNYEFEMDTTPNFNSALHTISHGTYYNSSWIYKSNTDLLYGTKYYWRARVRNSNDTSEWSTIWNFTTLNNITLDTPDNNSTGNYTDRSIIVDREYNNNDFENYDFEMDTTPNFNSALHTISHGTYYNSSWIYKSNTDLLYGQKYYWRARVRNSNDTSEWSTTWNFTTLNNITLDYPTNNLTGVYTNRFIACDIETSNTDFENYEFEMDTTPNFNSPMYEISHGSYFSGSWIYKNNSSMLYGQKYYWRAKVRNTNDTSEWSATWNFTTLDNITLDYPFNNSTSVSINQSIICDIETLNTDFGNYDFEIDTTENFNSPLYTTAHGSYFSGSWIYKTNSNLRYGQKYYWRARVRNLNDTSQWTSAWNFKTEYELTSAPDLIAPLNSSNDISYTSFLIDWNAISSSNNYQYQISTTNDFTNIIRNGNTSLTDRTISNLQPNTTYYWKVRGENVNGYSPWSSVWSFTTETALMTAPTLTSPANNATEIDYETVYFSWQEVFGANEYIFEISQSNDFTSGVTSLNLPDANTTLLNINNLTTYYWRVAATDGSTTSDWSEIWNFTTKDVTTGLNAPTLVSPIDNATNQSLPPTITWNEVTNATMYEYQYSTSSSFTSFNNDYISETFASISGLNNSYTYYWRVRASDGTDWSDWSAIWSFTTEDASSGLSTPTLVSPTDGATGVVTSPTLLWNIVPSANEYEYQYSTDEFFTTYMGNTTQSSSISIGVLDYNTEYFWRIKATDGTNFSEWSEVWSFTTENDISVNDIEKTSIVLYPNPAKDYLKFKTLNYNFKNIKIYDIYGKLVISCNFKNEINISELNSGTYFIIFENNKNSEKRVFIKE